MKKLFQSRKSREFTPDGFWNWFRINEKEFHRSLKSNLDVQELVLGKIMDKVSKYREGVWLLAGMKDENTAELIFTAEGNVKHFEHCDALVHEAPAMDGWAFTALKQPMDTRDVNLQLGEYQLNEDNLYFFPETDPDLPDMIHLVFVPDKYDVLEKEMIEKGVYLFLDNHLGERNAVTQIDMVTVMGDADGRELIPFTKLKDYLQWREKEFTDQYDGIRYSTENDAYHSGEGTLSNGKPLIAIFNSDLLRWDKKPSHPWMLVIELIFKGDKNGMPGNNTYNLLNEFEDRLTEELTEEAGYLNIGRQTAEGIRSVYIACAEFTLPVRVTEKLLGEYRNSFRGDFEIYRDKYWKTVEPFQPA